MYCMKYDDVTDVNQYDNFQPIWSMHFKTDSNKTN